MTTCLLLCVGIGGFQKHRAVLRLEWMIGHDVMFFARNASSVVCLGGLQSDP